MTLEEALKELGLERIDRAEEVRAAYLRLLRERRPEQNPEGFRRLREAYEFAVGWFDQADGWTALDRELGGHRAALEPNERSEDRREPTPSQPVHRLDFSALLERFWVRLSAYETATLSRAQSPVHVLYLVHRLIDHQKTEIAMAVLASLLDQLPTTEAHRLPVLLFARHLLRLHGAGHGEEASELTKKLAAWLLVSGRESDLVTGEAAATWQVCKELSRLPVNLRPEVRKALVLMLLEDDHAFAERILRRFATQHRAEARALDEALRTHAPNLAKFVNLPGGPEAADEERTAPLKAWLRYAALGALALLAIILLLRRLEQLG